MTEQITIEDVLVPVSFSIANILYVNAEGKSLSDCIRDFLYGLAREAPEAVPVFADLCEDGFREDIVVPVSLSSELRKFYGELAQRKQLSVKHLLGRVICGVAKIIDNPSLYPDLTKVVSKFFGYDFSAQSLFPFEYVSKILEATKDGESEILDACRVLVSWASEGDVNVVLAAIAVEVMGVSYNVARIVFGASPHKVRAFINELLHIFRVHIAVQKFLEYFSKHLWLIPKPYIVNGVCMICGEKVENYRHRHKDVEELLALSIYDTIRKDVAMKKILRELQKEVEA